MRSGDSAVRRAVAIYWAETGTAGPDGGRQVVTLGSRLAQPTGAVPSIPLRSVLFGLGSVFGKTVRDSRAAALLVAGLISVMVAAGGEVMASTYGSPATRQELAVMTHEMPPALRGFYGNPVNVDMMGGFISWHYGAYFALVMGLWSLLALSSTLAGEARRGNLDLTAATAHSRRAIAYQKVGGHLAAMALAGALAAAAVWLTGVAFATMPGDAVSASAAVAFGAGLVVRGVVAGSVAFALAPVLGRGAAAGIAGALMVAGYVVNGYRTVVPAFDAVAGLTWWSWTAGHIPLAGVEDWPAVAFTAAVAGLLLVAGAEAFTRRDIGVTIRLPSLPLPALLVGIRGPLGRAIGDLLPNAAWWAVGLAAYGLVMAAASQSLLGLLSSSPELAAAFRTMIPGIDLTTAAGFLQLAFADIGFLLFGLAVTTFLAGRWADEAEGRLELLLTTPLTRARWAGAAGLATCLAIAGVTVVLGVAIGLGVASGAQDPLPPAAGTLVLALYGAALAGIGMAAGGVGGPSMAVLVTAAVTIGTFLLDTLAPVLRLPDWVAQLALTTHLGEPFIGTWDAAGIAACVALAVAGIAIGAWGVARRDLGG